MPKRKPTAYDRDQHELICELLGASSDPKYHGSTVYEAVVNILENLNIDSKLVDEAKRKEEELKQRIDGDSSLIESLGEENKELRNLLLKSDSQIKEVWRLLENKDQELIEAQRELADLKAGLGDLMTHGLAGVLARVSNSTISLTSTGCEATSFPY